MTHPSISLERKNYPFDNQRLEFLGDAVIQLVVTEHLYRLYPDFSEGTMTKLRTGSFRGGAQDTGAGTGPWPVSHDGTWRGSQWRA
jgi:hypothetical protein